MKCKYCGKYYKTEGHLKVHENKCLKNNEDMVDKNNEDMVDEIEKKEDVIFNLIKDTIEVEDVDISIDEKMIKFFDNVNLENIQLNKDKLIEFKNLYKEYYKVELLKTCQDGIVHAFSKMYYTTLKIKKNK